MIPKFTEKTEADIAWNRIRREAEYRIRLAAANWIEDKKNEILPDLQERFEAALNDGVILELEAGDWQGLEVSV